MALVDDLTAQVKDIFKKAWTERDGTVIPEAEAVGLGNDAVKLEAVVLYADLAESTSLVDKYKAPFAAEIYKAFLACSAQLIKNFGGVITAYDGDRVMGVYIGDTKNTNAATTALKINAARISIIQPAHDAQYPTNAFKLRHRVGIDRSALYVARTGVRGANDLVWVGRAANHAAKMAAMNNGYSSIISEEVYSFLLDSAKIGGEGTNMWTELWSSELNRTLYGSNWHWAV